MKKRLMLLLQALCLGALFAGSDTGVRVNGLVLGVTTEAKGSSPWKFSSNVLTLTGEGSDYVLSGKNLKGDVRVEVKCNCLVTLRDFELDVSSRAGKDAMAVVGNHTLTLNLEGESVLQGAARGCGIVVPVGNALIVDSEDGKGGLNVYGGRNAAGIGGGYSTGDSMTIAIYGGSCGSVLIYGGSVLAQGGDGGAGIGGGGNYSTSPLACGGNGGDVRVYGGSLVAVGGDGGAGIGGGSGIGYATWEGNDDIEFKGGDGGTVDIYGGNVFVRGGSQAAAIGGGRNGHGGDVSIHGGTVHFMSGGARDVGAGYWERSSALARPGDYRIYGGSVHQSVLGVRPKNEAGVDLFPVTVSWPDRFASPALGSMKVDGRSYTYGMKDTTTADEARYVFWLPSGEAQFSVGGCWYRATVRTPSATAEAIETTFNAFGGRIVYNGTSGSQVSVASYKPGSEYGSLPSGVDVTRSGYEFLGWYDSQGRRVVDSDTVPVASRTLTAKWIQPIDRAVAAGCPTLSLTAYRTRPELTSCTWFGQNEVGYSGGNALRSGTIGNSQSNVLLCAVTGPGTVSFRYKISSESGFDKLTFHSGIEPSKILLTASGTDDTSWKQFSCDVPAGKQSLVWTYGKDRSRSCGEDCAYLDDIQFKMASTYTVRFNINYGTAQTRTQTFTVGKAQNLLWKDSQLGWSREGYTFLGWSTAASSGLVTYVNGQTVTDIAAAGKTIDLYAVWFGGGSYKVIYNRNTSASDTTTATHRIWCGTPTALAWKDSQLGWANPSGKTFLGWAESSGATTAKYANGATVTNLAGAGQTKNLYAVWKSTGASTPQTYTVRYNINYGTAQTKTQTFTVGKAQNLLWKDSQLGWSREGYTFLGWSTAASSGLVTYVNGQTVTDIAAAGKTIDLYAVWFGGGSYKVIYNRNTSASDTTTATHRIWCGTPTALAWKDSQLGWANPSGKTFLGWAESSGATTAKYANGATVTNLAGAGQTKNLYAVWQSK